MKGESVLSGHIDSKFQDGKRRARDKLKSIDGGHGGLGEGGGTR